MTVPSSAPSVIAFVRSHHASTSPRRSDRPGLLRDPPRRHAVACRRGPRMTATPGGRPPAQDLFGLTKVVPLHIEIAADEYQAMQPPAPAGGPGGPPPAASAEEAGRASERAESLRPRIPLGARGRHGGGQDVPGRRPPLRGERLLHGLRRRPEAFLRRRSGPRRSRGVPRPARDAAPERGARSRRRRARPSPSPSSARPESPRRARRWPR